MARLARVVVPDHPRHVTQRGNRRERTFFEKGDYALYRDLSAESSAHARTEVRAYCFMPNHVHIILVPTDEDGLRHTSPIYTVATLASSTHAPAPMATCGKGATDQWL